MDKIAIVSSKCMLPGANNIDDFWDILKSGRCTVSEFTQEELAESGVEEEVYSDKSYLPYRGFLSGLDGIDLSKLNVNNADLSTLNIEAKVMLKLVFDSISDMGYSLKDMPKNTSVYVGTNGNCNFTYMDKSVHFGMNTDRLKGRYYSRTVAPYIAYHFDLRGSAIDLYTACSSSSAAFVQGCQDLTLNPDTKLVIVGGVAIEDPQKFGYFYEPNGVFSSDGKCRTFDAKADGCVFSNGAGIVILKRLTDALSDGDDVLAVVEGYATNNDGKAKAGFVAPGIQGQIDCISKAWRMAGIDSGVIDYIEAHGSATQVGDPIEIYSLGKVLEEFGVLQENIAIGSVKSNIGHTTIASGIASIIKSILMIKNRAIVPTAHFKEPNQNLFFDNDNIHISDQYRLKDCKDTSPMTIGISNFGLGGTNAHIVLSEYIP